MARRILLFIWLSTVLLPTFSQWGTIAYFQVNKDYIARVLCENRDRPLLHCDGSCYLAKKLEAQREKQDRQTAERVQNIPVLQLFTQPLASFAFLSPPVFQPTKPAFEYHLPTYPAPLSELILPPCA